MAVGRSHLAFALSLLAGAGAGACGKSDAGTSVPVARVGDKTITAGDFAARIAEQPTFARVRYKALERKKEFLDGLVRSELLLQEAHRRGLDKDPEVRATVEKVLIQKLTRVYAEEAEKTSPASDADLRRYYDQHRTEFSSPTRVRVAHLFMAAPEKDLRRAKTLSEANRLLEQIKARTTKGEKQALELTASQRSDDAATKATGGDLGYRLRDDLVRAWGAPLADAAFALKTQNEIGTVVATDKGVHLIRLLGRQEGYEASFDAARSRIAERLKFERRAHDVDTLVAELKKKTKIEIDEKALARIDPEAVAVTAKGPEAR